MTKYLPDDYMKIVVYHGCYGCDTGCCGHVIETDDQYFSGFSHPGRDDPRAFAEALVRDQLGDEHVADPGWENCVISDD